jgi:hypothetical protein
LIAGEGPIQPMSMEPELSASISDGPALKVAYFALVAPSAFWKKPCHVADQRGRVGQVAEVADLDGVESVDLRGPGGDLRVGVGRPWSPTRNRRRRA